MSLRRVVESYGWLRMAADATPAASQAGRRSGAETPMPGAATRRYRSALRRIDRKLDRIADEIEAALEGRDQRPIGRTACPQCGRGGRAGAVFCDRCKGIELEVRK